ncbi:uncharacterized protein LOC135377989 [Ornithodoros turicata]|uniref:uncharacterized protein LOC135377989 n=1 Tax=Ornithodoros turicata TaxID=34597 RepID=UPI0031388D3E
MIITTITDGDNNFLVPTCGPGNELHPLDVYPIESLVDVDVGLRILHEPESVTDIKGKKFLVNWSPEADASEAYIVAAGAPEQLEKKRTKVLKALQVVSDIHCVSREREECTNCVEQKRRIEELEHRNQKLAKKLRRAREKCEMVDMVGRIEEIVTTASSQQSNAAVCTATKVDIGLGVCLDAGVLH